MMTEELIQTGEIKVLCFAEQGSTFDDDAVREGIGQAIELQAEWIALPIKRLPDSFFDLRTGVAGLWLQKLVNYRLGLAILGDVEPWQRKSKALEALIVECNRGKSCWFLPDLASLQERLAKTGQ
ncbi:DUF4180 domain-containing protein [Cedecea sp. NFIX57]|uniref:DUF4180 domain-containing protein n=1 Tax=Cedecea sp. NFIX57 TaxID=1566286 RepID=UPI000A0CC3EF|nr:DUF4180 domain-containing protein [Cedecea sp. NFIX57]SMG52383.1 protein of unknown function [Cedecea sp. NFIX57]